MAIVIVLQPNNAEAALIAKRIAVRAAEMEYVMQAKIAALVRQTALVLAALQAGMTQEIVAAIAVQNKNIAMVVNGQDCFNVLEKGVALLAQQRLR